MSRDELNVEPADLSDRASALDIATNIAHGNLTNFSMLASDSYKGFPGRSSAKFDQAQEHWDKEKELIAGIVTDLSVHTLNARQSYLDTDNNNAEALEHPSDSDSLNL